MVAKINPFNHPFRFCAEKAAAPLAAGNCVVIKGSEQAPLVELASWRTCAKEFSRRASSTSSPATARLVPRSCVIPDVHRIGFVGSVPTGRAIAREAADGS